MQKRGRSVVFRQGGGFQPGLEIVALSRGPCVSDTGAIERGQASVPDAQSDREAGAGLKIHENFNPPDGRKWHWSSNPILVAVSARGLHPVVGEVEGRLEESGPGPQGGV